MAKLHGIKEHLDHHLYDTVMVEEASSYRLFGGEGRGDRWLTNMREPYQLQDPFSVLGLGLRLLGLTRDEEDSLLDFFRVELWINDLPRCDVSGRLLSLQRTTLENWLELRAVFLQPVIQKLAVKHNYEQPVVTPEDVQVAMDWLLQLQLPDGQEVTWEEPSIPWQGYQLRLPLIIPVRQTFFVELDVHPTLLKRWKGQAQVTLFGIRTRDL